MPKCAGSSMERVLWNKGYGHKTIEDYYDDGEDLSSYFKWCFVRNPWERIVSAYEDCPEIFSYAPTFESFINKLHSKIHNIPKQSIKYTNFIDIGLPIYRIHFMPMHLLIKIHGQICIDFIGRFENLDNDWLAINKHFNIDCMQLDKVNARKDKIKEGRRNSFYRDLYNQDLIDKVGEIYADDISIFKYIF